jgi:hypothetical protein
MHSPRVFLRTSRNSSIRLFWSVAYHQPRSILRTSHAGIITIAPGTVYNTLFQGVTFYSDTGPSAVNIFTGVGNMNKTGLYFCDHGITGVVFAQSGTNALSVVVP